MQFILSLYLLLSLSVVIAHSPIDLFAQTHAVLSKLFSFVGYFFPRLFRLCSIYKKRISKMKYPFLFVCFNWVMLGVQVKWPFLAETVRWPVGWSGRRPSWHTTAAHRIHEVLWTILIYFILFIMFEQYIYLYMCVYGWWTGNPDLVGLKYLQVLGKYVRSLQKE